MMRSALTALASSLAIAAAAPAGATLFITVQVGSAAPVTVATSDSGIVSFNGTFDGTGTGCASSSAGCYSLSIAGQGSPTYDQPTLQSTSLSASSSADTAAGLLTITVRQTGLDPLAGIFTTGFTANNFLGSAQSATLSSYLDQTMLATQSFTARGDSSYSVFANEPGSYSESLVYALNFGQGKGSFNDSINLTASTAVPEPAVWGAMVLGFAAIGGALRRRKPALVTFR